MPTNTIAGQTSLTTEMLNVGSLEMKADVVDGQFNVNPVLGAMKDVNGEGKPMAKGVLQVTQGISFKDHSSPTELTLAQNGYDNIDWNTERTLNDATLTWIYWLALYPIVISFYEQQMTAGAIVDLTKQRTGNVLRAAFRRLEKQFVIGGQVGHSACNSFNGVVGSASSTGLCEAAAFGSQTHTVLGVSKSSFSTFPYLQNQWGDFGGSVNNRGIDQITKVLAYFRTRAEPSVGKVTKAVASENCYAALCRLGQAKVMDTSGSDKTDVMKFKKVFINGIEVAPSPWMPVTSSPAFSMLMFTPQDQPFRFLNDNAFKLMGWQQEVRPQLVLSNILTIGGQLTPNGDSGLASSAVFTDGESY